MSIIHEALKKVEHETGANMENQIRNATTPPQPKPKSPQPVNVKKFVIPVVFAVSIVLLVNHLQKSKKEAGLAGPKTAKAGSEKKRPVVPAKTYRRGSYLLEGIVYDQKAPIAIINGRVLKKGDTINQLKVIKISPTDVVLQDTRNQKKRKLSL